MKIDKAIEVLEDHLEAVGDVAGSSYPNAIKLGIEALKQLQSCRLCCQFASDGLLPGETKNN